MNISLTALKRLSGTNFKALPDETNVTLYNKPIKVLNNLGATTTPTPTTPPPVEIKPQVPNAVDMYNPLDQVDRYLGEYPQLKLLANTPNFKWFNGGKNVWADMKDLVTKANGKRVGIVLYAVPGRDNGNYSAGGLESKDAYYAYCGAMADAIGTAPVDIAVEPDALGLSTELPNEQTKQDRYDMLSGAIKALKSKPNVRVFLDASMWHSIDRQKELLDKIYDFRLADGTALNTSGYKDKATCDKYAAELMLKTSKPSIIDSSRNGNGEWQTSEADPWCNPPGRKLGVLPTLDTGNKAILAYYWVKTPGESDGSCRGWGSAGTFEPKLALELIK